MRAYSMDLRERALLDSDAGMKAADVAAKYRVSGSWVRLLKQQRRETGEMAPRVQRQGRRCMLAPHLHTLAGLIAGCFHHQVLLRRNRHVHDGSSGHPARISYRPLRGRFDEGPSKGPAVS